MKTILLFVCSAMLVLYAGVHEAAAQIDWRLSVKIVLQANGNRPAGVLTSEAGIQSSINEANEFIHAFSRGYQYRITEMVELPGHANLLDMDCEAASDSITAGVQTNAASYLWRNNAVNIYVTRASDTKGCAFNGLLVLNLDTDHKVIVHESGHHLGLNHTQGFRCGGCDEPTPQGFPAGTCRTIPGDDDIGDTLPDLECWGQNDIATNWFGRTYAVLLPGEKLRVDNTTSNIMCYRPSKRTLFTSGQLDRITDTSNSTRQNIATGSTWFVDRDNTCTQRSGSSGCTNNTGGPFQMVTAGVNAADPGDIVLVRPGNYNETLTITKAITLRATRGNALIGTP